MHWASKPENAAKVKAAIKKGVLTKRLAKARAVKAAKAAAKQAQVSPTPEYDHAPKARTIRALIEAGLKAERDAQRGVAIPSDIIAYAAGWVGSWITNYAASTGVSSTALADELGAILRGPHHG